MSFTGGPPLRRNLSASASELKDFVASLKGKSPAEAMGLVARTPLFKAILISGAIQVGLVLLLTIPFAIFKKEKPPQAAAQPAAAVTPAPATKPATKKATASKSENGKDVPGNVMRTDASKPDEKPNFGDDLLKDNK